MALLPVKGLRLGEVYTCPSYQYFLASTTHERRWNKQKPVVDQAVTVDDILGTCCIVVVLSVVCRPQTRQSSLLVGGGEDEGGDSAYSTIDEAKCESNKQFLASLDFMQVQLLVGGSMGVSCHTHFTRLCA